MMNEKTKMKLNLVEHIKKYPMLYGAGWIVLLGVVAWLFHSWPGGFWDWLRETPNGYESGSTTVRNLGLIVAGLIALPLTLWRIWVADRQAKAAQKQVETSQDQVTTSQRSLLNERYQKGAEMLGSEVLSVRLGGIYALAKSGAVNILRNIMFKSCVCSVHFVRNTENLDDKQTYRSSI